MSRVGKKAEIRTESKRRGGGMTIEEVPAVLDVPAEQLIEMSKQLDDAAQQLDFTDSSPR